MCAMAWCGSCLRMEVQREYESRQCSKSCLEIVNNPKATVVIMLAISALMKIFFAHCHRLSKVRQKNKTGISKGKYMYLSAMGALRGRRLMVGASKIIKPNNEAAK